MPNIKQVLKVLSIRRWVCIVWVCRCISWSLCMHYLLLSVFISYRNGCFQIVGNGKGLNTISLMLRWCDFFPTKILKILHKVETERWSLGKVSSGSQETPRFLWKQSFAQKSMPTNLCKRSIVTANGTNFNAISFILYVAKITKI